MTSLRGSFGKVLFFPADSILRIKLALDSIGSRVVESYFSTCDLSFKEIIAKELVSCFEELSSAPHGKYIIKSTKYLHLPLSRLKTRLELYVANRKLWRRGEKKSIKARESLGSAKLIFVLSCSFPLDRCGSNEGWRPNEDQEWFQ